MIGLMATAQPRTSCSSLFKQPNILPSPRQYTLLLMSFIIDIQEIFQTNSSVHNINMSNKASFLTDQLSTYLVIKKMHSMLAKKFSTVTTQCDIHQV
jgi:hypothetical protein